MVGFCWFDGLFVLRGSLGFVGSLCFESRLCFLFLLLAGFCAMLFLGTSMCGFC